MANQPKKCVDCGHEFESKWKTAKRCPVCRTLNNTSFSGLYEIDCYACDRKHLPRKRGDEWCGQCQEAHRPPSGSTKGTCAMCHRDTLVLHEDIQVCLPCTTDPARRKQLVRALINKQIKRRELTAAE